MQYGSENPDMFPGGRAAYTERELRDHIRDKSTKPRRRRMDIPFFCLTLIILTVGVLMVLSASFARAYYTIGDPTKYFVRQTIFAVSGVVLMLAASFIPVRLYRRLSMPLLYVSLVLLALVAVPGVGITRGGSTRWLGFGSMTFQPSEILKLAIIMSFAVMICNLRDKTRSLKYVILPFGFFLFITAALLVGEPHYSALIIVFALAAIMLFAGGLHWGWYAAGIAVVAVAVTVLYGRVSSVLAEGGDALNSLGYIGRRLISWVDPFSDRQGDGWQIIQSLYAVGSGGMLGLGLGQGRQKYLYLPEEHNDFIFSVVCEELGFVGAVLILLLFALLIIRGYWIALHARDRYSTLVATGITSLLALQVFFNVAVVTNLIPCTGISLPFFSYGGTALWLQLAEMGVILAISREIPLKRADDDEASGQE